MSHQQARGGHCTGHSSQDVGTMWVMLEAANHTQGLE